MARVAHELVEAAAAYGPRGLEIAGISCNSGEANHECARRWQNHIMDQVNASREATKSEPARKQ